MENKDLYRGKRIDGGSWVSGRSIIRAENGAVFILPTGGNLKYLKNPTIATFYGDFVKVDPATVSQCSGVPDKNGKLIYAGDIVYGVSRTDSAKMVVIFECGQYRMVLCEHYYDYVSGMGYYDINCFEKEIIGNITDNPELLPRRDIPAETVQIGGITVNNHGNVQNQSFTAIGTMEGDLVL